MLLFLLACVGERGGLSIEPVLPGTTDLLVASAEAVWFVDGVDSGIVGTVVPPSATSVGQRWQARGVEGGVTSVLIGNTAPTVSLAIVEEHGAITVTPSVSDPDGTPTLAFAWTRDDVDVGIVSPAVSAAETSLGEVWTVTVTADDGYEPVTATASVKIGNRAPVVQQVALGPDPAFITDVLSASLIASDADDDPLEVVWHWFVDGARVASGPASTLPAPPKGSRVRVEADVSDGFHHVRQASFDVVVDNAPPSIGSLVIEPLPTAATATLSCVPMDLFDPDGDDVAVAYAWSRDGVVVGAGDTLVAEPPLVRDEVVACGAFPVDGVDLGEGLVAEVVVANDPPELTLSVDLEQAGVLDVVTATVVATDRDADPLVVDVSWSVDDVWVADGTSVSVGAVASVGDVLRVRATVDDGFDVVERTADVDVVQTPPSVQLASNGFALPFQAPLCAFDVTDPDGDVVAETRSWSVDGSPFARTPTADDVAVGQIWTCEVSFDDGHAVVTREHTVEIGWGNVLLVVADDYGNDKVSVYAEHPDPPPTPTLDGLAARGTLFRNAYSYKVCTPTRAALQTGRYGRRTGFGNNNVNTSLVIADEETTLPELLDHAPVPWATNAVGKWHLADKTETDDPLRVGWGGHIGSVHNYPMNGIAQDYFAHDKSVDGGAPFWVEEYATTAEVDDALDRIDVMAEPWLLYLAFHVPHGPIHLPPQDLFTSDADEQSPATAWYDAMVESMDIELGRLLASLPDPERTTVIFLGDNGTNQAGVTPPNLSTQAKNTIYEGGINVPLIVAGPAAPLWGTESEALVHVVDVLPTVADLAGIDLGTVPSGYGPGPLVVDGQSLVPLLTGSAGRDVLYAESFGPNGAPPYTGHDDTIVRDARWKLVRRHVDGTESLHDLQGRFDDGEDLLLEPLSIEAQEAYDRLSIELDALEASF